MIKINNHLFKILEDKNTYYLICTLEDNEIPYKLSKNTGILIEPDYVFKYYKQIQKYLTSDNIKEIYRDGIERLPKFSDVYHTYNNIFILVDGYFVSPYNGSWFNKDNYDDQGTMYYGMVDYKHREIKIPEILRYSLSFNLLEEEIYRDIKTFFKTYKYFYELVFSRIKLEFIGGIDSFKEFKDKDIRGIIWRENDKYGIWTWPKRYENISNGSLNIPEYKLVLKDIKYGDKIKLETDQKNGYFRLSIPEITTKYIISMFNDDYNNFKFSSVTVWDLEKINQDAKSIDTVIFDIFYKPDNDYKVSYNDYLNLPEEDKKEVESLLIAARDCGFLYYTSNKNNKEWKDVIEYY